MTRPSEIARLRNLGPRSEAWLNAVGVYTREDLVRLGSVVTFKLVQEHGFAPSLNLLYAMEGAIRDVHWTNLPKDVVDDLRKEAAE